MGSGSQLKAETIKCININSSCRLFIYKYSISLSVDRGGSDEVTNRG